MKFMEGALAKWTVSIFYSVLNYFAKVRYFDRRIERKDFFKLVKISYLSNSSFEQRLEKLIFPWQLGKSLQYSISTASRFVQELSSFFRH